MSYKGFKRAIKNNPHFAAQSRRQEQAHIQDMNMRQFEYDLGLRPLSAKEQQIEDIARKVCPEVFALMDMLNEDLL